MESGSVMKASFFRNVQNYEILYSNSCRYNGIVAEYRLIATMPLNDNEFATFCSDFQKSYDFLLPFVDKAVITHGIWWCISVVCGYHEILVVMDHYQYPRYLAIASK